jgi:predicted DNA-binding protein
MTTIQISDELGKRLSEMASQGNMTKDLYIEQILKCHLEDAEDIQLALERRDDPGPDISLEELEKKLGLKRDAPVES